MITRSAFGPQKIGICAALVTILLVEASKSSLAQIVPDNTLGTEVAEGILAFTLY
ncbi:hypothetical protein ACKFKG_19995 [Phormidesmis sp. 146-35]